VLIAALADLIRLDDLHDATSTVPSVKYDHEPAAGGMKDPDSLLCLLNAVTTFAPFLIVIGICAEVVSGHYLVVTTGVARNDDRTQRQQALARVFASCAL